jgi:(1->4)-alpha-D-glucan 1-alpha-D-glucosylmutase
MAPPVIPSATYRLQFNASFPFDAATGVVEYLDELGISHCYASNYFTAVPGSTHGYDVTDPGKLNPELGDEAAYWRWIDALHARDMGHILDLVPNHMGIAKSANPWWQDVLEKGPHSAYADVFDIDWHPLKAALENKILLPILGDSYGAVLERQLLRVEYEEGAFHVRYGENRLPIAPSTYGCILEIGAAALVAEIGTTSGPGAEWRALLEAIRTHAPSAATYGDHERIKRRLNVLAAGTAAVSAHITRALAVVNGRADDARSFDLLDQILAAQAYRVAHWRVAGEEINYRRFFDINELAAIRMEDPAVFERVHAFAFDLLRRGAIDGFRIDHVDGLYDPGDYLERLRMRAREVRPVAPASGDSFYVIVEKILGYGEDLPEWPVMGTTGYEFLVMLNGLFVDQRNEAAVNRVYEGFTRMRASFRELAYRGKRLVLRVSMAGELNLLAHQLSRFSERNRYFRDFTLNSLAFALREIIACFPVYRTYVNDREPVTERDGEYIERAVREAKRRNPHRPGLVFDFIRGLLQRKGGYVPATNGDDQVRFVGKFQQVTSPISAKGIEDTALYIYNRLVSLNEVGGEPDRFGVAPDALHAWFALRAQRRPHSLSASSTHDTKRSEDVRARLNVLSELPGAWKQATARWARANRRCRSIVDGQSYPSRNEEYLFYQTLVGTWPARPMDDDDERQYRARILEYMHKAMREAKVFTSWINPSEPHERAMTRFVEMALARDNTAFRGDFLVFQGRIARYAIYNSLAQLAVKIGAPGVPDFYQGTELWDFSLVDPDNRRPVDYHRRRILLKELDAAVAREGADALVNELMTCPTDDRMKLYAASTLLRFRRAHMPLFQRGDYQPLAITGGRRDHLFVFARTYEQHRVIVAAPRLVATLLPDIDIGPIGERVWGDTCIELPLGPASYRHVLTGQTLTGRTAGGRMTLAAAEVFAHVPIAFLERG